MQKRKKTHRDQKQNKAGAQLIMRMTEIQRQKGGKDTENRK